MIITLITIAILIAGIVILKKYNWTYWQHSLGEALVGIGVVGAIFIASVLCIIQIPRQVDYEKVAAKREVLEYRLEHREENIVGNEMLYSEITEFNNDIRGEKRYADSPWVNWFANDKIADIDYIDYTEHD
jgi:hypothetical protein